MKANKTNQASDTDKWTVQADGHASFENTADTASPSCLVSASASVSMTDRSCQPHRLGTNSHVCHVN